MLLSLGSLVVPILSTAQDVRKRANEEYMTLVEVQGPNSLLKYSCEEILSSDTCPSTSSAISSYVFPVALNASVRVDSP